MSSGVWDLDPEATQWRKAHKQYETKGRWKTIKVELERRKKYVILTRLEWEILQEFVDEHELSEIKAEEVNGLPPGVRAVIYDWCKFK